jgi:hypothetical protein
MKDTNSNKTGEGEESNLCQHSLVKDKLQVSTTKNGLGKMNQIQCQ